MLSCFSGPRSKGGEDGGRRRHRRIFEAVLNVAHSKSDGSHGSTAAAVNVQQPQLVSLQQQSGSSKADTPLSDSGSTVWQQPADVDAAPQPPTPPPSLPRISRQQQQQLQVQPAQQVSSSQQPTGQPPPIAVARPSWASEGSSLEAAAWVAGRSRHGCSGDSGPISDSSFTSARSSFSSQVSGPASDAGISGFWPPYRDSGSAAPSTRGGSEDGSPRPPRPHVKRPSWYLAQFGPDYATLDDLKAASGELNRAAALAIGWQQDGGQDSDSRSGGSSSRQGGGGGLEAARAVAWPQSQLVPLDPRSPVVSRNASWAGGRCEDDTPSEASAESAAPVQALLHQAEAAFAEGRLLHVRELLRQAAARHGCSFRELLADGAAAAFGTGVTCSLDLQQLGLELDLIRRSLSDAQDQSGYETSSDGDLRILYRHNKGSGVHSFRFEATYDCPLSHMLALTREFDLLGTWNRMALDPAILGEPSIFANIVYTGQWMPFPLSAVDLVVRTNWSDLLEEEGAMLVTMADHSEHAAGEDLAPLPRKAAKRRRIQLLEGSSSILQPYPCTEDGRQRCRCAVLAHLNPHVPHVPGFLITFVLKVLSPFVYNATRDMLAGSFKSPDMELPRRMASNPQLYQKVEERFQSPPHGTPPPPPVGRSLATSFRNL